jgi:thiopeptide-type bacteriocin biosynthesis protein
LAGDGSPPYQYLDGALVRATCAKIAAPEFWPDLNDDAEVEQWYGWLVQVWDHEPIASAITHASPSLAARVATMRQGKRLDAKDARRVVLSVARYLVRMRGRATPFGLFAGVNRVGFAQDASVQWSSEAPDIRARADAVWLAEVIARLESCDELLRRLPVMMNDQAVVLGERLVVRWQPHSGTPGRTTAAEVSARYGPAVEAVIQMASTPIRFGDLAEKLASGFPTVSTSRIEVALRELVACGALITSLRPPSTRPDGFAHVVEQLHAVDATKVADVSALVHDLIGIHAELQPTGRWTRAGEHPLVQRMRTLAATVDQPLMLDSRLDCTVVLPEYVATEAANAMRALSRLTPHPTGHPAWWTYHAQFLARYGIGALVPVTRVTDPAAGLGFPTHYADTTTTGTRPSRRDERLLAITQQAALDGRDEVVLDEDMLGWLQAEQVGIPSLVPHAEMCVEIAAPTTAALSAGDFTLTVRGVSRTGAMTGRFLGLLPNGDRERARFPYGRLPVTVEGAVHAQLSFPPCHPRVENVACSPRFLSELITLAEHRDSDPGRIPLRDLAVTADNDRLYLVSLTRHRVIEPTLTNAAARHTMPPLARFLFEVSRARQPSVSTFAWGMAACLPFLPRLRYGRSVLAPARWRIMCDALPGPDAPWPVWASALKTLREHLRLPTTVSVGESDRRLRLNLDMPMDLTLLRDHLAKVSKTHRSATVTEAPGTEDDGWLDGRAHEIVIPLATTAPPSPAPAVMKDAASATIVSGQDGVLPGTGIFSAKVYGNPAVFDTILARHLPELVSAWDEPPQWWFIRYRDPRPHLRLRLHVSSPHEYGLAATRVGAWVSDLRARGLATELTLDTYQPEIARYGTGAARVAAEALFAADSAAALAQLQSLATARHTHPSALTAASMAHLTGALAGSTSAGMRWLIEHADIGPSPSPDRDVVRQAIRLMERSADSPTAPADSRIASAWRERCEAAAAYAECLAVDPAAPRRDLVLGSLLHLHHVRAHGIAPEAERSCHRLTRAIALSWTARAKHKEAL